MGALESRIADRILQYLNGLPSCKAEKLMGNAFSRDKPDINGCWKGHMFKIEVKADPKGYKATEGQKLELILWRNAGATTFIAYSVEDVKKYITADFIAVPVGKTDWKILEAENA